MRGGIQAPAVRTDHDGSDGVRVLLEASGGAGRGTGRGRMQQGQGRSLPHLDSTRPREQVPPLQTQSCSEARVHLHLRQQRQSARVPNLHIHAGREEMCVGGGQSSDRVRMRLGGG